MIKLQITDYRLQTNCNIKFTIPKKSARNFAVVISVLLVICVLSIEIFTNAYASDLESAKVYFLNGNYSAFIKEGEDIMAKTGAHSESLAELYYLLGLSYLKEGNYLRASDIFEIILKEFKAGKFTNEARIGLADVYFLKGDYDKSESYCQGLIGGSNANKMKASAYYRLSKIALKKGMTQEANGYLDRLKNDYPLSPELRINKEITGPEFYYTVQVGSFSKPANARNLSQKLAGEGYEAHIEEGISKSGAKIYRVRVGKFPSRQDAKVLEKKVSREGYPTKIFP